MISRVGFCHCLIVCLLSSQKYPTQMGDISLTATARMECLKWQILVQAFQSMAAAKSVNIVFGCFELNDT